MIIEKEEIFYQKTEQKLKSLPPIFNEYYISMRANRKAYTSMRAYLNNILHFVNFLYDDNIPSDFYKKIGIADIESYFISLETKETANGIKRMGDDILQQRWSALNHFFELLIKRGYISENPIAGIDRPKNNTEHKVTYLNKVEINRLLRTISKNPIEIIAIRDSALIKLALSTGLRVSALVNINIEDIDWDNQVINVIEKRKKIRQIPFGDNMLDVLKEWIEARNERFPAVETTALFLSLREQRMSVDAVADMLDRYCKLAGIQRITPHKLRATAACMLAKNNIPVKAIAKQLGHSNISTTMKYIDVFNEDMEKTKNILDNLF